MASATLAVVVVDGVWPDSPAAGAVAAVAAVLATSKAPVRVAGAGHSFTALVPTDGTLMTLVHLAQELHRSPDGLRISLRKNDGWAGRINQAKRRFGRRVYFDTAKIAAVIDESV